MDKPPVIDLVPVYTTTGLVYEAANSPATTGPTLYEPTRQARWDARMASNATVIIAGVLALIALIAALMFIGSL